MAGYGKTKVNTYVKECVVLDINKLDLQLGSGKITWTRDGEEVESAGYRYDGKHLHLNYRSTTKNLWKEESEDYSHSVPIDRTEPNFGGERLWFLCPNKNCRKRVATSCTALQTEASTYVGTAGI